MENIEGRYKVFVVVAHSLKHECMFASESSLEFFTNHTRLVVLTGPLFELDH